MNQRTLFAVTVLLFSSCTQAYYPIDPRPTTKIDTRLLGKWGAIDLRKSNELIATDPCVEFTLSKVNDSVYGIICKQGTRKKSLQANGYLSIIDSSVFLNVVSGNSDGYFFIKILNINAGEGRVVVTNIADTSMRLLTSCDQVREKLTMNLHNPSFYSDTTELYKIR